VVTDLEKLSKTLSEDTPEKLAERAITEKAADIATALREKGFYDDPALGIRISADLVPAHR
jgi:hypothetical protein